jgi:hypothetical protein
VGAPTAKEKVPSLLDDVGGLFTPTSAGRSEPIAPARIDEVELEIRSLAEVTHAYANTLGLLSECAVR